MCVGKTGIFEAWLDPRGSWYCFLDPSAFLGFSRRFQSIGIDFHFSYSGECIVITYRTRNVRTRTEKFAKSQRADFETLVSKEMSLTVTESNMQSITPSSDVSAQKYKL